MSEAKKRELVQNLFNNEKKSPNEIQEDTSLPIGLIYHYCEQSEIAQRNHKAAIRAKREEDRVTVYGS